MADPKPYTRGYSFENYQADVPDQPLPGVNLDIELDKIAGASDELTARVNAGIDVSINNEALEAVAEEIDRVVFVADNMDTVRDVADLGPNLELATDLFLGAFANDPATAGDGGPLATGATYYNTLIGESRVWAGAGAGWIPVAKVSTGGVLQGGTTVSGGATEFMVGDYVSLMLARNGLVLEPGTDYTMTSPTVTVPAAQDGDRLAWFAILKGTTTDAASFVRQTVLTTAGVTTYATNTAGDPLNLTQTNHVLFGGSPFGMLTYGVDYTVADGALVLDFVPAAGELFHVFSMPRFTNSEAQAVLQDYRDLVSDQVAIVERIADSAAFFGAAGNGDADDTGPMNVWAAWPGEKRALPEREYRINGTLSIPAGAIITGTLRIVTSQPTGTVLNIGANARVETIHIRHDGTVPAAVSATIGAGFQCSLFRAEAAIETGHDFLAIDNTGAKVARMEFRNFARPLVLGLGGTSATVGGRFGAIVIDRFIRGVAANRADGWTIDRLDIRGRSPNTSKSPGRNGILVSGCSGWTIGDLNVDGAGEHAFRVGGAVYGGESSRWKIGRFTARDTGGCVFKLADDIATTRDWEVGSIYALGSLGEAPGRNSELMRISYAANGYIGTATARRESGTYSVFGGLHVANVEDIHVGEIDIAHYAAEALAVRDQDSVVNATAKNVTVGYLRAVGSVGNLVAFGNGTGQIDGIRIGDGYFDTDAPNLIASDAGNVISRPVEVGGYLKNGSATISGAAAANAVVNIRRASDSATLLGRGAAQGGDVGVVCRQFDGGNVGPDLWGGLHIEARGVSPANGAFGAGVNFSRPGSPGRRGAALVPYQDGAAENNVGLRLMAGSNVASTNALISQWAFRHNGDFEFNISGVGPVLRSPNGTRYRIVVSDAGALSAVAA